MFSIITKKEVRSKFTLDEIEILQLLEIFLYNLKNK